LAEKVAMMHSESKSPVRVMDFRGTFKGGGGPDKTILNSAVLHDPEKVDVRVVYLRDPCDREYSIDKWAKKLNISYVDIPDGKRIDITCIQKVKELIDRYDIQLLHAHDDKTLLYGWIIKKMRPRLHIMYTCHSHSIYGRKDFDRLLAYLSFYLRCRIQIFLMKRFQKPILTIAKHTRQSLISDGLRPEEIEVLHNGIDTDEWYTKKGKPVLKQELCFPDDVLIVGTVARIDHLDKDLSTFYRVAAKVVNKIPNVKFVIVGDGEGDLLNIEKKKVTALGLDKIIAFTGHRTDIKNIYQSFDLFLMTSRSEGMPNTILEAMSIGVPVVSTRVGGVPEIIVEESMGLLAPIGDAQALSDQVVKLLNNPRQREQIAVASRHRIEEKYSFNERVWAMEKYYEQFAAVY
jgi:glycosyltransferase involved in cell wall biosynthesis